MSESELQASMMDSLRGVFAACRERNADAELTGDLVWKAIGHWWGEHPGLEDHTVNCAMCHKPTSRDHPIKINDHESGTRYLCKKDFAKLL